MQLKRPVSHRLFSSRLLISLLSVSLCLAGCGKQKQVPQTGQTTPVQAEETAEEAASDAAGPYDSDDESRRTAEEFDQLTAELYEQLASSDYLTQRFLCADPEKEGVPLCEPALPDISRTAWEQHMDVIRSLKFQLETINSSLLKDRQQILYRQLAEYADTQLMQEGLEDFLALEALSPTRGIQILIPQKLALLPFHSRQDVENYFVLLADMPRLFHDLTELAQEAAENGLILTPQWKKDAADSCASFALGPEHNSLITSFSGRLDSLPDLTQEERNLYETRNTEAVTNYVIPAYQKLTEDIRQLPVQAAAQEGLCGRKNGRDYYQFLAAMETGTSCSSIRQLKSTIEDQLQQNMTSINELLVQYPELSARLSDSGRLPRDPEALLAFLKDETEKYFPSADFLALPSVQVIPPEQTDLWELPGWTPVPSNGQAAQTLSPIRIRSGIQDMDQLYAALSQKGFPGACYRSTFQNGLAQPSIQKLLSFPGWEKGWDAYAGSFAVSFDNGLTSEAKRLIRLSQSSSMAVHALVDIQVNYYGWGLTEVTDFLSQYYNVEEESVAAAIYQKALYSPADSLAEYTGYLEIRQMKTKARTALGNGFQETAFHQFLLETGPAPFGLIRDQLEDWMVTQNLSNLSS